MDIGHHARKGNYVVAAYVSSASPDQLGSATNWPMAPEIIYANSPRPTVANPTFGTSQYLTFDTARAVVWEWKATYPKAHHP
jgi:hypothetical protein